MPASTDNFFELALEPRKPAVGAPSCHAWDMASDELIDRFWREHRLSQGTRQERLEASGAAWGEVDDLLDGPASEVVRMLVALAEAAPSEEEAGLVGAGPIEELVARRARQFGNEEGRALLEELDAAARRSARFRSALAFAFFGDEVPKGVRDQLQRFR